jgi:hypothetical protein
MGNFPLYNATINNKGGATAIKRVGVHPDYAPTSISGVRTCLYIADTFAGLHDTTPLGELYDSAGDGSAYVIWKLNMLTRLLRCVSMFNFQINDRWGIYQEFSCDAEIGSSYDGGSPPTLVIWYYAIDAL